MMKSQINTMRQLQELVLIRDEHHQTGDGSHLDLLNDSIDALRKKLIPQAAGIYDRLYKRNHVVLAALSGNVCSGCGMQVPIAQAQQVRLAQHLVTCSNCGRILFAEEGETPRNIAEKPDRDEIRTGVSRFSAEELMVPNLKAATAAEAIGELADAMEQHGFISNGTNLAAAAMDRENVLPTTMGEGFAFPHVRGVEGGRRPRRQQPAGPGGKRPSGRNGRKPGERRGRSERKLRKRRFERGGRRRSRKRDPYRGGNRPHPLFLGLPHAYLATGRKK